MKPAWDALAAEFDGSNTVLIADVDCTVEKQLCSRHGVKGFPTIKAFPMGSNAEEGQLYEGGRDFDSLKQYADHSLGPSCSNDYIELCDAGQKATLDKYNALSTAERQEMLDAAKQGIADAEGKLCRRELCAECGI